MSEQAERETAERLGRLEDAMWGTTRDPESGLVSQVRRLRTRADTILIGVIVAIITPAATILLTRAAG